MKWPEDHQQQDENGQSLLFVVDEKMYILECLNFLQGPFQECAIFLPNEEIAKKRLLSLVVAFKLLVS